MSIHLFGPEPTHLMFESVTAKVYYRHGSFQLYLPHFHYIQEPGHQADHEYYIFKEMW